MDYFIMKTDGRLSGLPNIQVSYNELKSEMSKGKTSVVYVKKGNGPGTDYADYLEKPVRMVADRFQKILQKYQKDVVFHRVVLVERETGMQKQYCLMMPPRIACADKDRSCFDAAGNVKDFVLDLEKAGNRKIFVAEDYNNKLLVRLDVAESLLRRDANGIWFEPVKVSERRSKNAG